MTANYQNDNGLSRSREWERMLGNIGTARPAAVPAPAAPDVEDVLSYLLSLCPPAAPAPILRGGSDAAPTPPRKSRKKGRRVILDNRVNSPTEGEARLEKFLAAQQNETDIARVVEDKQVAMTRARDADIARHSAHTATITKFYGALDANASALTQMARNKEGKALLKEKADANTRYEVLVGLQQAIDHGLLTGHKVRSLAGCLRAPIPFRDQEHNRIDAISVHAYPSLSSDGTIQHRHGILGLQHCGSPLKCPVCADKISYVRRGEIQKAVDHMAGEENCETYFLTLTAPHFSGTDIVDFVAKFRQAKTEFGKCAAWKKFAKAVLYQGQITAYEVTLDAPWAAYFTGPHFHNHSSLFLQSHLDEECIKIVQAALAEAWSEICKNVGLVPLEKISDHKLHGLHFEVAKSAGDALNYLIKEVSFEISPPSLNKSGRREGDRLSHWQIMRLATSTHPELLPVLDEIFLALKGVKALSWSPGLKKRCGVQTAKNQEKAAFLESEENATEDMEVAKEAAENQTIMKGEEGVKIIDIPYLDWTYVCDYGAQRLLVKSFDILSNGTLLDEDTAKSIVDKICNGINPITGEVLRPVRSLQHTYTYKAYRAAVAAPPPPPLAVAA